MATIIPINANKNTSEKPELNEAVGEFIYRNRKRFIYGIALIGAATLCFIASFAIRDYIRSRNLIAFEALHDRYDELRYYTQDSSKAAEVEALLLDLQAFAQKTGGYSGARSFMLVAAIHSDRENWEEAENAWVSAAKKNMKIYLAPIALFNAGVAAEEAGKTDQALAHYQAVLAYPDDFPLCARAQFSIGRLQEEAKGDTEAALDAYRQLLEKYPTESLWTSLANSKIIALAGSQY